MLKTAANCCSSSSGNGVMLARATVCNENVVRAPVRAPIVNQPAILSFWLMGTLFNSCFANTCRRFRKIVYCG